ncbi:MAG: alanine:cation symporter family protein, partial [Clostridia bacterium]|nr:alanine:cation symporter family protein [Clostridia bacterium]
VQASKISDVATTQITGIDPIITAVIVGVVVAAVLALIILGGIKSIGRVTSILVPFMSLIFIVMSLVIIFTNVTVVGAAFASIFKNIVSLPAVAGGVGGFAIAEFTKVIQKGLARGVFSNEAGLGSSVIAHSASATREPVKQGLWGIFEVFFDTFIICTLTAIVVLVSMPTEALYATNAVDTAVSMEAFSNFIPGAKMVGSIIYSIMMPLFAFTTILAWSYYGERCVQYLFTKTGPKGQKIATTVFKVLYVFLVIVFVVLNELQKSIPELPNALIWGISDTFNGLMALPNLIGLIIMGGLVAKITKNYFDRKKGLPVEPMLSAYPEQNAEFIADIAKQAEEEAAAAADVAEASEEVAADESAPAQEPTEDKE